MQSEPIPESASLEVKSDIPGTAAPRWRGIALLSVGTILCLFTLAEVNYPQLSPQSQLAIFAMLWMVLCFLHHPLHSSLKGHRVARASDLVLALL